MKALLIISFLLIQFSISAQDFWEDWDSERIDNTYLEQDLPYGTVDEDGDDIDYVYVPTELESGTYEVEIEDASGDLYHIKGTEIFLTFSTYAGYFGYGKEGILEISSYGGGYFYERP